MDEQSHIFASTTSGPETAGNMDTSPSSWESKHGALQVWGGQAKAHKVHSTAKSPSWRLARNLQLTTLPLLAVFAAAFAILHCYSRITANSTTGKAYMRLLAEGGEAGRDAHCRGAELGSNKSPASASDGIEPAALVRTERVLRRLIHVTGDLSSIAVSLPPPFTMHVADLLLGFCIQEVAALSALLGVQFDEKKAKVLQAALESARGVIQFSKDRDKNLQQKHASRLVKYAKRLSTPGPEYPPLASAVRSQMLEELLGLQERALGLVETAVSSFLNFQRSLIPITAEALNELIEELRRIIYTRRKQVFMSKHLSHHLRVFELRSIRGVLMRPWDITKVDEGPEETFKEKLEHLTDGRGWIKLSVDRTQSILLEASGQKTASSANQHERHASLSSVTEARLDSAGQMPWKPWSPWSSAWPTHFPVSRVLSDSTFQLTVDMPEAPEGRISQQSTQPAVNLQSEFISPPAPLTSPFPLTTPQSVAAAANEMLYSLRLRAPPAEMQRTTQPYSRYAYGDFPMTAPSSPTREQGAQSGGILRISDQESRPEGLHLVWQQMVWSKGKRDGIFRRPLDVTSPLELLRQDLSGDAHGELPWLDGDSDSG